MIFNISDFVIYFWIWFQNSWNLFIYYFFLLEKEIANLWPGLILINDRPPHPQSQGSVEKGNLTLKNSLIAWMWDINTSQWTRGLHLAQWGMKTTVSEATNEVPYRALFGIKPRIGLRTNLPSEFLAKISTGLEEERFEEFFSNTN